MTSSTTRFNVRVIWLVFTLALVLMACPPVEPDGQGDQQTQLMVVNSSSESIQRLYVSLSSSTEWGTDQLGGSPIAPGMSRTWNVSDATYDMRAESSSMEWTQMGVTMANGSLTRWILTDSAGDPNGSGGNGGTDEPNDPAPSALRTLEIEAIDGVNAERVAEGLAVLREDSQMSTVARAHSQDMLDRDFFNHVNPDGDDPFVRMDAAGITYRSAAENIAWNSGHSDPAAVAVTGWMNSDGHRRNILTAGFDYTGMGVAGNDTAGYYFTQIFLSLDKSRRFVETYYVAGESR